MKFAGRRTGSVLCPGCGQLVGVRDAECLNCGRRYPGMLGFAGILRFDAAQLAAVILGANVALFLVSLLMSTDRIGMAGMFGFLSPDGHALFRLGAAGAIPVFALGKPWAVFSAGWLHGGLLHILFNMYWVWNLFPAVSGAFGAGRTLVIYQVAAGTGFLLSSFMGAYVSSFPMFGGAPSITVGASASLCGLLGALLYYGRRTSSEVARSVWRVVLFLAVFGFLMPGIDNAAHLGGFLGGYFVASRFGAFSPERGKHAVQGAGLLALSAAALLLSLLTSS